MDIIDKYWIEYKHNDNLEKSQNSKVHKRRKTNHIIINLNPNPKHANFNY